MIKLSTGTKINFLSLLAGNASSKLILAAGGIILAKYYGASNYGFYNVFVSGILIVTMAFSLRLENVIVLARENKEARNVFNSILAFGFISIGLLLTIVTATDIPFLNKLGWNSYLLTLGAVCCFFSLANNSFTELFTRLRRFQSIAVITTLGSLILILVQAVLFWYGMKEWGLPLGLVLSSLIIFLCFSSADKFRFSKPDLSQLKTTVTQHKDIIQYTFLSDIFNSIANNSLPIIVVTFFTQHEVGVFAMALKIITTPLLVLYQSSSRLFFLKSMNLYNMNDAAGLHALTRRVSGYNFGITLFYLAVLNTLGVYLLHQYFDESWKYIGAYILAMSYWILARGAVNPISPVIMVIKKNYYSLLFNMYFLTALICSFYLGYLKSSLLLGIYLFSFFTGSGYLIFLFYIFRALKKYEKKEI